MTTETPPRHRDRDLPWRHPPGQRSRTPSSDIKRELVAAADVVLVRDGPGGVTVRAVAAQAGIAPMGVYNRLGGKDGLIDALLIRGFDRLSAALAEGDESDQLERLRLCGWRYRRFALENRHYYAIMFEAAIPHEFDSPEVTKHGVAAFGELVRNVEMAAAAGGIAAPDPREVAQQIWSSLHGAVALELKGMVLTPDPEATYRATLQTLLRGLAPQDYARVVDSELVTSECGCRPGPHQRQAKRPGSPTRPG